MGKYKFSKKHLFALLPIAGSVYVFPQGAIFLVCFFAVAGVIALLVFKLVSVLLAPTFKLHDDFLKTNGFVPCTEEESRQLKEAVGGFKTWKQPEGFYLADPVKAQMNGKTVFQYYYNESPLIVTGQMGTRAVREFEMIVPFPRRSFEPVIVVLRRNDGMGKMLQKVATKLAPMAVRLLSSKDHPVEVLKLPPELENRKIMDIIGPPQRTVHDLLDPNELEAIIHGVEVGVENVMVAGNSALLGFAGGYVTENGYTKLPPYLAELTSRRKIGFSPN